MTDDKPIFFMKMIREERDIFDVLITHRVINQILVSVLYGLFVGWMYSLYTNISLKNFWLYTFIIIITKFVHERWLYEPSVLKYAMITSKNDSVLKTWID